MVESGEKEKYRRIWSWGGWAHRPEQLGHIWLPDIHLLLSDSLPPLASAEIRGRGLGAPHALPRACAGLVRAEDRGGGDAASFRPSGSRVPTHTATAVGAKGV